MSKKSKDYKRKCCYCNRAKARHLYYASQWKKKGAPVCKSCTKKHSKSYRQSRDTYYRSTYDITLDEYEAMLERQGGACYICRKKPGKRRLAVDHCHKVEKEKGSRKSVRGLLCHKCNEYLGHIGDDPVAGLRLTRYLDTWEVASDVLG